MRFLATLAILFVLHAQADAQFTFYASGYEQLDKTTNKKMGGYSQRQLFNVTFFDKMLVHTIFNDEDDEVKVSQVYQITNIEVITEGIYAFTAKSGVSGSSYDYRINLTDKEDPFFEQILRDESYKVRYKGTFSELKTFEQK